jgi:hypothetical protein
MRPLAHLVQSVGWTRLHIESSLCSFQFTHRFLDATIYGNLPFTRWKLLQNFRITTAFNSCNNRHLIETTHKRCSGSPLILQYLNSSRYSLSFINRHSRFRVPRKISKHLPRCLHHLSSICALRLASRTSAVRTRPDFTFTQLTQHRLDRCRLLRILDYPLHPQTHRLP